MDSLSGLTFSSPLAVVGKPFSIISFFSHRWMFGWIGCRWYGWAGFFFGCGSLITMTAVSLDRYLKICHLSYGKTNMFLYIDYCIIYECRKAVLILSAIIYYTEIIIKVFRILFLTIEGSTQRREKFA